jgi:hypothetical protein
MMYGMLDRKGELKMTNKFKIGVLIGVLFVLSAFYVFSQDEDKGPVTQVELAKALAEKMDLDINKEASEKEYFGALEERGIKPAEGWDPNKVVTKRDLEDILVRTGRLQAEVASEKDSQSVLKKRGIVIPEDVNRKTVNNVLDDKSVKRLFETPAVSGLSIPFPKEELKVPEKRPEALPVLDAEIPVFVEPPPTEPPPTEPPTTEPPTIEPPTTEPPRPSGGGAQ